MITNSQILAVYATAEKAIRRTCARFNVRPTEDTIADLQQGTLEKLLKSYDASRGTPDQLAWRIAANEATSYLRGRKVGAIKNDDQSLTVEDDNGTEVVSDLADDSSNPFELIAARQLDNDLTIAISNLSEGLQAGVKAALASDEDTMSNAERQAKFRAVDALAESLRSSHFARKTGKPAKRAKVAKRSPKVAEETTEETPALRRLSTTVRMEMELTHLVKTPLVVVGPYLG